MAAQLLNADNADASILTIQDLLGHSRIRTKQPSCRVSNLKVQRDYQQDIVKVDPTYPQSPKSAIFAGRQSVTKVPIR